jgi:hypothetical protein
VANNYVKPFDNMVIANSFKLDVPISNNEIATNINNLKIITGYGIYDYIGVKLAFNTNFSNNGTFSILFDLLDA